MDLPKLVKGDKCRFMQVLINLIKNAFKFTHKGKIIVYATFDYEENLLRVHVRDTGRGIKPSDQGKLLKPFS